MAAAVSHTNNTSVTKAELLGTASLSGNTRATLGTGGLTLSADHTAAFNEQITSLAGGIFAGTGGDADNEVSADTEANVGNYAAVTTPGAVSITATNHASKPNLVGESTGENLKGTTGGLVSAAGASDQTVIAFTTLVNIGDYANVSQTGVASGNHNFTLAADNDYLVQDLASFETGGAASGADVHNDIRVTSAVAHVTVGTGATVFSVGTVDMSARGQGTIEAKAEVDVYGIGTITAGETTVDIRPDNKVEVKGGALVTAYGDLNLMAGADYQYHNDQYSITSSYDGFAGSAIPISDVNATAYLIQYNNINVDAGSHLATARQAGLYTDQFGDEDLHGLAKAESWASDLSDALLKAQGGGTLIAFNNVNLLGASHGVVTVDGIVETGINRNLTLDLSSWNQATGVVTADVQSPGITFTTGLEQLQSSLVTTWENDQTLLLQYGSGPSANAQLATYYTDQIASLQIELLADGLLSTLGDPSTATCTP